jgi:hypothetical protein
LQLTFLVSKPKIGSREETHAGLNGESEELYVAKAR